MSNVHVVIGANYGDEGKGLITDYLVHREKSKLVVRFNGGAQAGHTVVTPGGHRHVFSHFGSGTFHGADTFLSKYFVANPMIYLKERTVLESAGVKIPKMFVDPRVMVSTPYDMMVNEYREKHFKHGSCGLGVTDTIDRNNCEVVSANDGKLFDLKSIFKLNADDVYYNSIYDKTDELHYKLQLIRKEWVPLRLQQLGIPYTHEMLKRVMDDNLIWKFLEDIILFGKSISITHTKNLSKHDSLIFEGGQGLGLDQVNGHHPHVTKSFTGLTNVREICKEAGINAIDVYYVTRAYLTRHGAGPMENELKEKPYKGIKETTNFTNEFQGKFRYGNLDVDELRHRIAVDLKDSVFGSSFNVNPKLAVTCVDHLDDVGRYISNGKRKRASKDNFSVSLAREIGLPYVLESRGPTRDNIKERFTL